MDIPILFIYSSVNGHLGCLLLAAIVNNTAMNMELPVHVWVCAFSPFVYILKRRIARSYGNSAFNFLRNYHTIFLSDGTILQYQSCTRIAISYILPNTCYFLSFLDHIHPNGYEVVPHYCFALIFSMMSHTCFVFVFEVWTFYISWKKAFISDWVIWSSAS